MAEWRGSFGSSSAQSDAPAPAVTDEPQGAACSVVLTAEQVERRGMVWIVGAFLICPCHLPLTLWLAGTLLGGGALGAALRGHPVVAATVITLAWTAATWHGFHLMRSAHRYAARAKHVGSHPR